MGLSLFDFNLPPETSTVVGATIQIEYFFWILSILYDDRAEKCLYDSQNIPITTSTNNIMRV